MLVLRKYDKCIFILKNIYVYIKCNMEEHKYMNRVERKIDLKEHQQIMFQILCDYADFCDKHNLKYYLDAGTLLGAVRHKGFIPWDNDIDVCMMRPDYDRFITLIKGGEQINDHLVLEIPDETMYTFLKIGDKRTRLIEYPDTEPEECYIYIDVFPKDGISDLSKKSAFVCKISGVCALFHWFNKHSISYWSHRKKGVKRLFAKIMGVLVFDKNIAYKLQNRLIRGYTKKNPISQCEYVTTLVNGEFNGCCPRNCWDNSIALQFETRCFKAPVGYDTWMSILYGNDYMTPPPPDKQRVHNVQAYIKEG